MICSTEPETFCHTAAEALSVGTPVICYDFGNVPLLAGESGRAVPPTSHPSALWAALADLLEDPGAYHQASRAAPGRVQGFTPQASAGQLLHALGV